MTKKTTSREDQNATDFILDLISLSINAQDLLEYVQDNFSPEDVFSDKELSDWALDAGFVWRGDDNEP